MREKIIKKAEAIWPMCRKNELYTKEMFIADWLGAMKTIISESLPKEKEVTKYKECNLCKDRWINEEDKGFNKALKIIREKLEV